MTIQYNWKITNLECSNDENKAVFSVAWQCSAEDTYENIRYSKDSYGKEYVTPDLESDNFISYENITEQIALNWLYNLESFEPEIIEQGLAEQILLAKTPRTLTGKPWA
jgi:hypothetical protein